jgi:LEA14-like dessication related protein
MKRNKILVLLVVLGFVGISCSGYIDAFKNIQRLQFKLGKVHNFKLAEVAIGDKLNPSDLGVLDMAKLVAAFSSGTLKTQFTLDLLAKNPNDGTGGTPNTSAVIKALEWKLYLDQKEVLQGNLNKGIEIPGVGQETVIPIEISFDMMKYFSGENLNSLINLALVLGGKQGSSSRLELKIKPTVDTIFGPITYPNEITVIDKEFRSQ